MKTYLFDFDGTLVDSMPSYVSGVLRVLKDYKVAHGDDVIKIVTPLGFEGAANYFIKTFGIKEEKNALVKKMQGYMLEDYFYRIPAKNNVVKVLKELKKRGASLNVLTASPHLTLDACLKRLGVFDLFDNVWSCEDFFTTKADPNIYVAVAEKLGVDVQSVLFLDDNLNADRTAKLAGMKVCGVYDVSSDEYVEEIKRATDFYIYDFNELLDVNF